MPETEALLARERAEAARERVAAYLIERDEFMAGEAGDDDVLDTSDGGSGSTPLLLSDLRALVGVTLPSTEES